MEWKSNKKQKTSAFAVPQQYNWSEDANGVFVVGIVEGICELWEFEECLEERRYSRCPQRAAILLRSSKRLAAVTFLNVRKLLSLGAL